MIEASYLDHMSDRLDSIFSELQTNIETSLAARLKRINYGVSAQRWQQEKLKEVNSFYNAISNDVRGTLKSASSELQSLLKSASAKSITNDNRILRLSGKATAATSRLDRWAQIIEAGYIQTMGTLTNLSNSTGSIAISKFTAFLDTAHFEVVSGAFTPDKAVESSVRKLSQEGIYTIEYASGRNISVEAGARRAIVTGVNKTTANISLNRAIELGYDTVKTSEHIGAREEHAAWQGKIFSLTGKSSKYPNFYEVTGYGTVTGLCGANCRHNFYPCDPRVEDPFAEIFTSRENAEMYALDQEQRYNERMIRGWKRRSDVMEAGGQDNTAELLKVKEWQKRQAEFVKSNNLARQYAREQIA
jgi:hypothetical protein